MPPDENRTTPDGSERRENVVLPFEDSSGEREPDVRLHSSSDSGGLPQSVLKEGALQALWRVVSRCPASPAAFEAAGQPRATPVDDDRVGVVE